MTTKKQKIIKENISGYAFLLPYIIIFSLFFVFPFIYGLVISLFDWNFFDPSRTKFVGFDNYIKILFDSTSLYFEYFWTGLGRTLLYVLISVPVLVIVPLFLAICIDAEPKLYKLFRTILFMPTVFSISAVILIWKWQLNTNGGFINALLVKMGFQEIPFLLSQPWAWISIVVVTVWWTMGTNMVILGAGLKNVDKQLYEAASMDGAKRFQIFRHITMPSLAPQMLIVMITTVLASFGLYGQPHLLTQGGPNFSTTVLMMRIIPLAYGPNANPGVATSMAVMMGLIMIIVSITQAVIINRREKE